MKKARSIIGKPLPNRQMVIEDIISKPAVQDAIEKDASATGKTKEELEKCRQAMRSFISHVTDRTWTMCY